MVGKFAIAPLPTISAQANLPTLRSPHFRSAALMPGKELANFVGARPYLALALRRMIVGAPLRRRFLALRLRRRLSARLRAKRAFVGQWLDLGKGGNRRRRRSHIGR